MYAYHRYRGEIPKLAAIFSRHGEQFGGIRFYSESACVNCIFLRYERVFNRARKAATSATHVKVIARVICIAHSPHLFSAKSGIPPNCSPCREKNLRGRYWNFGICVSISVMLISKWGGCRQKPFWIRLTNVQEVKIGQILDNGLRRSLAQCGSLTTSASFACVGSHLFPQVMTIASLITLDLTGGNWQKWKRVFLTSSCHEIYRDEAVGLKSCKNAWKITIFVKMWNLGQYRENLIFCQ